jgi:tryptophan synthase alpha chain
MNRIDQVFQERRALGKPAFMPFITAGDPDLSCTVQLMSELSRRGANLIELGIPYSDPIADGPVIQASYTRALNRGVKLDAILDSVREFSAAARGVTPPTAALVCMVSYAMVHRRGADKFVRDAKHSGFEGAIVPDLPVEEAGELAAIARRNDFKLILLVTPTTPRDRAVQIARIATGFIYYVSITGITGERSNVSAAVLQQVSWLKTQTDVPVCIGFGISRPEHVRMLAPVADGMIVGSAIVRRIAEGEKKPRDQLIREIGDFAATLIEAIDMSLNAEH